MEELMLYDRAKLKSLVGKGIVHYLKHYYDFSFDSEDDYRHVYDYSCWLVERELRL